jgi:hypothetical protein
LQHELITLVLSTGVKVLLLQLGQASLRLCRVLIPEELFLCQTLLLGLETLLLLKVALSLLLSKHLLLLLVAPLLLQTGLLRLVFFLLAPSLVGPEVANGLWLGGHLGWRRRLMLNFLCRTLW